MLVLPPQLPPPVVAVIAEVAAVMSLKSQLLAVTAEAKVKVTVVPIVLEKKLLRSIAVAPPPGVNVPFMVWLALKVTIVGALITVGNVKLLKVLAPVIDTLAPTAVPV